jgi:hypothetical protein
MKNDELDRFISSRLEMDELKIPPALQDDVRRRIKALVDEPRRSAWSRLKIWAPLMAAAVLLLIVSLPMLFPPRPEMKKISQIRTEFSIPDKNIKILWVQREDFHLPDTNAQVQH